ncbi:MAG: fructosamine kinase family protein [Betaproteobacteria bacterium]|nr:fructosamine kinase family protein [Betaproteobacteria bacterium]
MAPADGLGALPTALREAIAAALRQASGFVPLRAQRLGGSASGATLAIDAADGRRAFVKLAAGELADALSAEEDGLRALQAAGSVAVPRPLCGGRHGEHAFLALEWLELAAWRPASAAAFGAGLAALHRHAGARFGWPRDNWIGASPQPNAWGEDWMSFFRDRRLAFQLERARRRGYGCELEQSGIERLLSGVPALLAGHTPQPSLVHGDLWSGNAAALADERPAIFDPAVHYADREVDLAMSELFGGFPEELRAAYRSAWPLAPGYETRKHLYNLYHVLNHLNLFGRGYLAQAQQLVRRLNAELR